MKTQLRIMATVVGILVSGVVVAMPSQPAHSTLTVNPGASAGTQSTGGQIEFSGSITDTSCNIDSTSANQIVDLGKWASSYFTGAGSETTKTAFHIKVKDCPATVTKVSVLFDGTRDSNNSNLLAVNGGAQGVAIKLYEDDKATPINLGTESKDQAVIAGTSGSNSGTADLEFFADYISTSAVSAGSANGTANFNMVYN
ncbi:MULTISPECIES: fimbrial protein [Raoultella]|jgi:major type 1 subunit fimbrin (pilin)|uniref:Fimbrial protein n=1 Tax=Raoultella planticola TaxID=575 RepID=A0A2X2EG31_RAOPL|nr:MULTISPECIES: fimbrial protein [Raoultella]MDU4422563.1 fimbrial protein [Raoultella sp.]AUV52392.1 fimbrial protein [Raoultella planticola]EJR0223598.1 fimbrial protein [Raoultella planticola]EJR0352972.1 fimbrial protein [Raoultella planticola]EKW3527737.1 fimbrial protein [Raoultella planticola]